MRVLRAVPRFLVLFLATYGPLAPVLLAFLLAVPPLIVLVDWPLWLKVVLLAGDVIPLVGLALWLGPGMVEEVRRYLRSEPPS